MTPTDIFALNIALSGDLYGGFQSGLTLVAGPSKHFKTLLMLFAAKAYMDKYPEAIMLFYDSEFGTPADYFKALQFDLSRIVHTPITNLEELKFDIMAQLENIDRTDKIFIAVDSLGNLASKKEVEDALKESSAADMTRAKQMKSVFRMVTPHLTLKDIPMWAVNHTYQCGTGDMLVLTESGPVSLKNITEEDYVYTSNGLEKVVKKYEYDEAYVNDIELEDGTVLSFTSGHKFKVDGQWLTVDELAIGMELDEINHTYNKSVYGLFKTLQSTS